MHGRAIAVLSVLGLLGCEENGLHHLPLGPEGGRILLDEGVVLDVPPGALSTTVEFSARRAAPESEFGRRLVGGYRLGYAIEPATDFRKPINISIPVGNAVSVWSLSEGPRILVDRHSILATDNTSVSFQSDHLTIFFVVTEDDLGLQSPEDLFSIQIAPTPSDVYIRTSINADFLSFDEIPMPLRSLGSESVRDAFLRPTRDNGTGISACMGAAWQVQFLEKDVFFDDVVSRSGIIGRQTSSDCGPGPAALYDREGNQLFRTAGSLDSQLDLFSGRYFVARFPRSLIDGAAGRFSELVARFEFEVAHDGTQPVYVRLAWETPQFEQISDLFSEPEFQAYVGTPPSSTALAAALPMQVDDGTVYIDADSPVISLLACLPNTQRCANGALYTCNEDGTGEAAQACESGRCQDEFRCFVDTCMIGEPPRCREGVIEACNSNAIWDEINLCSSGRCQNDTACVPQVCAPSSVLCRSGTLYTCSDDGTEEIGVPCASGTCLDSTVCQDCANGVLQAGEQCDDGNALSNDGCSSSCEIEEGWNCNGNSPTVCQPQWQPIASTNAPVWRYSHVAIWTGTEMLVWGGSEHDWVNGGTRDLASGGRYDPRADVWQAMSMVSAPPGRRRTTAVWTGTEMLVWGGYGITGSGNPTYVNTGGRYSPSTDSWAPLTTVGAPSIRSFNTAIWTGTEMIVWGGQRGPEKHNTGGRYSPGSNTWSPVSTVGAPSPRSYHTAVWTGTEMIVWGGVGENGNYYSDGGRYDPATDAWTPLSLLAPQARSSHSALWVSGRMIVWGGWTPSPLTYFDSGGQYDPVGDAWTATTLSDAPIGRDQHTAVAVQGDMLVWGGRTSGGATNTGAFYDSTMDRWRPMSTLNAPSVGLPNPTVIWTGQEIVVWGGGVLLSSGMKYTP